jgi:hypothetical protein
VLVHLVIFNTSKRQPIPAATVAIAFTSVVHSRQFRLYPLRYTSTEPALSTQICNTCPRHSAAAAEMTTSGPISSKADNLRPTFFPSMRQPPALILLAQGM